MSSPLLRKLGGHERKRKFPGVRGRRPDRKSARQAMARAVEEDRSRRTDAEQIAELDARLGKNVGATRERARLAKQMRRAS